jgi:thiamine-monophosphate kinase
MIDVSDGLVADLARMAELSGVGFDLLDVPVAAGATLAEALGGGDDYVLAFTMPGTRERRGGTAEVFAGAGLAPPCLIGTCLPDASRRLMEGRPVQAPGWDHSL